MAAKPKRRRIMMRITKGAIVPADQWAERALRERGYKIGDIVAAEICKARNPGFHRLAHQLGILVAENIEDFTGMEAHSVLKRLQIESNQGCDEVLLKFPGIGPVVYRVPRSLSFESLDEGEFRGIITGMCRHIAATYWPSLTPEQIESMAGCMVSEAA